MLRLNPMKRQVKWVSINIMCYAGLNAYVIITCLLSKIAFVVQSDNTEQIANEVTTTKDLTYTI